MNWIILALSAALLWSIMAIIHKFVRVNYFEDTLGYLIFVTPTILFAGVLLLFQPLTWLKGTQALLLILNGAIITVGGYFYLEAIHREEVSKVFILFRVGPLIVLVLSTIFLKEALTFNQYLAFILIFIGSTMMSFKKVEDKIKLSVGAVMVLISATFFGIHDVFLKYLSDINLATVMIYREFGYFCSIIIILLFSEKARKCTKKIIKDLSLKQTALTYGAEIIGMTGMYFSYLAIQRGPVSLVKIIEGFEVIFVLILTILISVFLPKILKEKTDIKTITIKIISIALMLGGLYLIVI